ncbi:MobF family relaxase [Acidithiobacillus sp.]|uniref:MobF family relaxase n=1 Tax=Acidithiobacillus sp. TaxID=1872118 RepID=UPI003CFD7570
MLKVTHLKSSGEAVGKYLKAGLGESDQVAEYYGEDNPSYWIGGLADELQLTGQPVDESVLADMLDGKLPNGEQPQQLHDRERRIGEDFTFSAPKSVSIAALALGQKEAIEAHDEAVRETLEFIQERILYARRGKGGLERENNPGVAIAAFRHIDARPVNGVVAPDLHTHCVAPNMGRRKDGTLGGIKLDLGERGDLLKLGDAMYKARLADKLRQAGIALRSTKDGFELASIPDSVIAAWSPRKQQIDQLLAAQGLSRETATNAQKQWANLASREGKQDRHLSEYLALWQAMAREQELSLFFHGFSVPTTTPDAAAANAMQHLGERDATFRRAAYLADTLTQGCAYFTERQLTAAAEGRIEASGIALDRERLTTFNHIAQSAYILEFARQSRGEATPMMEAHHLSPWLADREQRQGFDYSADQRSAIANIATSPDRVQVLVGAAGAGKTTAMAAIAEAASMSNMAVIGLAPSHAATQALRDSIGRAETLASWILRPRPANGRKRLIVLDEVGMVGTADMAALLAGLEPEDRLLLVGDPRQLTPVSAGEPFAGLLEVLPTSTLDEIRRQYDPEQRRIATLYAQGKGQEAAEALSSRFIQETEPETLIQQAAQAYLDAQGSKVALCSKRDTTKALNQAIHALLHGNDPAPVCLVTAQRRAMTKAERERAGSYPVGTVLAKDGKVRKVERIEGDTLHTNCGPLRIPELEESGWQVVDLEALPLFPGDTILMTDTLTVQTLEGESLKLRNGTELTIVGPDSQGRTVAALADGRQVGFDPTRTIPAAYAWARTIHRSQGQTVDCAIVVDDGISGASLGYVATSRQRESLQVFSADRDALAQRIQDWGAAAAIRAVPQHAARLEEAHSQGIAAALQATMRPEKPETGQQEADQRRTEREEAQRRLDDVSVHPRP